MTTDYFLETKTINRTLADNIRPYAAQRFYDDAFQCVYLNVFRLFN